MGNLLRLTYFLKPHCRMSKSGFVFLLLILGNIAFHQAFAQFIVKGVIMDSLSKKSISFVNVNIVDDSGKTYASAISDSTGVFKLEYQRRNKLFLQLSHISYKSKMIRLDYLTTQADLGIIILATQISEIDEVVIRSTIKRVEAKFDKTIYRIDETTLSSSISIYDLLRTLPGVGVNESGDVIYRGSSPTIYVNNSPSFMLFPNIESIPIDLIDKIEVIDASMRKGGDGKGGIINIKLRSIDDGLSGVLSLKSSTLNFEHIDVNNHFLNLNYKYGRGILVNNFSLTSNNSMSGYQMSKEFFTSPNTMVSLQKEINSTNNYNDGIADCLGYVLEKNRTTRWTFAVAFDKQNANSSSINNLVEQNISANQLDSKFSTKNIFDSDNSNSSVSMNYWHELDSTERFIESNFYCSLPVTTNKSTYLECFEVMNGIAYDSSYTTSYNGQAKGTYSFYGDLFYNRPIAEKTRWNFNYILMGDVNQRIKDQFLNNEQVIEPKLKEDISNIVFNQMSARIGTKIKKIKLDGGLTLEDKLITGKYKRYLSEGHDSVFVMNKNFLKLLPSIAIAYNINEFDAIRLNLAKTVKYPSFNDLQGYTYTETTFLLLSGNPELIPSDLYSLYFGYLKSRDNWNLSLDLFYSYTNRLSTPVSVPLTSLVWNRKPYNVAHRISQGIDISFWMRIKNLNFSLYSSVYNIDYNTDKLNQELSGINITGQSSSNLNYNINSIITYKLRSISFRGSITIYGNQEEYDGYQKGWVSSSFNFSKTFYNDKLRIGLSANNLFRNLSENGYYSNAFDVMTSSEISGTYYDPFLSVTLRYDIKAGDRGTENIRGKR